MIDKIKEKWTNIPKGIQGALLFLLNCEIALIMFTIFGLPLLAWYIGTTIFGFVAVWILIGEKYWDF